MANRRVDLEPTGQFLDEAGLITYRLLFPAIVEELQRTAFERILVVMDALGAKTDDTEYYRAHALAALYAAADEIPDGELIMMRANAYKREAKRKRTGKPTNDARNTYRRIVDGAK